MSECIQFSNSLYLLQAENPKDQQRGPLLAHSNYYGVFNRWTDSMNEQPFHSFDVSYPQTFNWMNEQENGMTAGNFWNNVHQYQASSYQYQFPQSHQLSAWYGMNYGHHATPTTSYDSMANSHNSSSDMTRISSESKLQPCTSVVQVKSEPVMAVTEPSEYPSSSAQVYGHASKGEYSASLKSGQ